MSSKPRFWDKHKNWEEAEIQWDIRADTLKESHPIKRLKKLPNLPAIRPKTAKNLKWKALHYLAEHDKDRFFINYFFKHPFRHSYNLLNSYLKAKPFKKDGDFFLYEMETEAEFRQLLKREDTLLVIGFSYCHKPFECPSGRFTQECMHDEENPVCGQCFIGKCVHSLPEKRVIPVFITTVHHIGEEIVGAVEAYPDKEIIFLITACEMTLQMFGDWGNMVKVKGIGVRLDGQICNTMKAFVASEFGVKPGMAVVLDDTQKRVLELIELRRDSGSD